MAGVVQELPILLQGRTVIERQVMVESKREFPICI